MSRDILIKRIEYNCPICDTEHEIEVRERKTQALLKGEVIDYDEVYYICRLTGDEENEFVPGKVLNRNLLRVRDAYRSTHSLLTSIEIKEIRSNYKLTQSELSFLLGWGEVTITRYESKKIQDSTYDQFLRLARDNPSFALESLIKNADKFEDKRFIEIRNHLKEVVLKDDNKSLKFQELKNIYLKYDEATEFNGYKLIDIDKISQVIGYFAEKTRFLYKVKLMKLLWYADVVFFAKHNNSMTGLVYEHRNYGALPIGFNEIIQLPTVSVEEELVYDNIAYKINSLTKINLQLLSHEELIVLDSIVAKFKDTKGKAIVDYMHQEKAYKETINKELISYDYGKELNEFQL